MKLKAANPNFEVIIGTDQDDVLTVSNPTAAVRTFISGGAGDDTITGGAGRDTILGGAGNDIIDGFKGNDRIFAGDGDDYVFASTNGHGHYDGGAGFDTLDFSHAHSGLNINMGRGTASGGDLKADFTGFEKIIGSNFGDHIKGSSHADVIVGGNGDDVIQGGGGGDMLTGGLGHNTFVFTKGDILGHGAAPVVATITDFNSNATLDLSNYFKGQVVDATNINDLVHVGSSAHGDVISVKHGQDYIAVAVLGNVHDELNGSILLSHHMLLV